MRTLLPLLLLLVPVAAQDEDLPPDETSDLVARYLERGEESLREGNYDEARLRFGKVLKRDPRNVAARLGNATTYRLAGAYEKADAEIEEALKAHPGDRGALVMKAQLALLRGRLGEARDLAQQAIGKGSGEGPDLTGLAARVVAAEALARRGQRDEARTVLDHFLDYHRVRADSYDDANFRRDELRLKPDIARPLAEELTLVAAALRLYVHLSPLDDDFLSNANELLLLAQELDPQNWDAWIERVRLTRLEREGAIAAARKIRDLVTPKNPELADLWTEVARSLVGFQSAEARAMAETALKINPRQTDARAVVAKVAMEDNEYPVADEQIKAGLAVDPNHRSLLALKATLELLIGNEKEFEEGMKRVLEVDPRYGEGFRLAGQVVAERQRRFDTAVALVRRGLELDPTNADAHADLGVYLANLGQEEAAKDALDKSKALFPWSHPVRENFRTVLDYVLGKMTTVKTEHFVIRFDLSEHDILSLYVPQLLEECWADMTKRYGFSPESPVLVEVFRKADDFSVRAIGLIDFNRYAVGICFGGVMAIDSPQAMGDEGVVHWAPVARHEFGHVMSLQLSKGQVPRWFTEGLSVLEEKPLDPGWCMEANFEREIYDAYHTGMLPRIGTFDAMFRTERVGFAYYLGGLMLAYLHSVAGEEGIVKALGLYGEDKPMEEVFEKSFGLKLHEFDAKFRDFLGERMKGWHRVPNYSVVFQALREKAITDPNDGENLLKLAWAHFFRKEFVEAGAKLQLARTKIDPKHALSVLLEAQLRPASARASLDAFFAAGGDDFDARLIQAGFLRREGKADAFVAALEKAHAAWPMSPAPLEDLRRYYTAEGRADEALRILEQEARLASTSLPIRYQLAKEYAARGRDADALKALEEAANINPFNAEIHVASLPLYRKVGDKKKAVRAARCLVALRGEQDTDEEMASRWLSLAEVLLEDGQPKEAATALQEAERLAPDEQADRRNELKKKLGQ